MNAAGAPITKVQHRLGHANTGITLTVYSHFLRHTDSGAADRLAEVLRAGLGFGHRMEALSLRAAEDSSGASA